MIFNWEARAGDRTGRSTTGTVEADTPRAAIAKVAIHLWSRPALPNGDELDGHDQASITVFRFVPSVK